MTGNGKTCKICIEILPQVIFEEVNVSVSVQKPILVEPETTFLSNLYEATKFYCNAYMEHGFNVVSLDVDVMVSFISSMGVPKVFQKKATVPLRLVMDICQPEKENKYKFTLNINQNPVPLTTLFPGNLSHK